MKTVSLHAARRLTEHQSLIDLYHSHIWPKIGRHDPSELEARIKWKNDNKRDDSKLSFTEKLIWKRYEAAADLAQCLQSHEVTGVTAEGVAVKARNKQNIKSFSVEDLLLTISGERREIHEAYEKWAGTHTNLWQKVSAFTRWEIGGKSKDFKYSAAMACLTHQLQHELEKSPNIEQELHTRFFPTDASLKLAKANQEWDKFWKLLVELVLILRSVDEAGLISSYLDFSYRAGEGSYRHFLDKSEQLIRRLDIAGGQIQDPKVPGSLGAWAGVVFQTAKETAKENGDPLVKLKQFKILLSKIKQWYRRWMRGKKDALTAVKALAKAVRPTSKPPEISNLEPILAEAKETAPGNKREFVDCVNEILENTNYCFRLTNGEIARHLVLKNGAIQYAVTSGDSAGFHNRDAEMIRYRRPYVRRQINKHPNP